MRKMRAKRKVPKTKQTRVSLTVAQTRFLAGLFTNLAAGWLGVLFITPNFDGDLKLLTQDALGVILCSWLALKSEEKLEKTRH